MTPQRDNKKQGGTARLTRLALLTAIALTIFMAEAQLPTLVPIQGVKLGLANVVTVYAVFSLGAWEAGGILLVRVLLGSLFTGQMMSLLYSAVGGVLALLTALGLKRILTGTQIWVASCFSAVAHNLGQIAVAIAITRTPALLSYLPVLLVSGLLTGLFTGLSAQALLQHLHKIRKSQIYASDCGEVMSKM